MILAAACGFIAIAVLALMIGAPRINETLVRNSIAGLITEPSVLDGSRVVGGSAFDIAAHNTTAAKLSLGAGSGKTLLGLKQVFKDCAVHGRECSEPAWSPPAVFLAFEGIAMPSDAICAQSFAAGSNAQEQADVICLDRSANILYFFFWDIRSR